MQDLFNFKRYNRTINDNLLANFLNNSNQTRTNAIDNKLDTSNFYLALLEISTAQNRNKNANNNGSSSESNEINSSIDLLFDQDAQLSRQESYERLKELLEKNSILIHAIKYKGNAESAASSTKAYNGPYSYLPGLIGNQSDTFDSNLVPFGELFLLFIVLFLWFLSIILCLSKYRKLRSLHPIIPPYPASPMHIEEVKIVKNEQDCVIYIKQPFDRNSISNYKSSLANSSRTSMKNTFIIPNGELLYTSNITSSGRIDPTRSRSLSEPKMVPIINPESVVRSPYFNGKLSSVVNNRRLKNFERNQTICYASPYEIYPTSSNTATITPKSPPHNASTTSSKTLLARGNTMNSSGIISRNSYKKVSDRRHLYARSKYFVRKYPTFLERTQDSNATKYEDTVTSQGYNESVTRKMSSKEDQSAESLIKESTAVSVENNNNSITTTTTTTTTTAISTKASALSTATGSGINSPTSNSNPSGSTNNNSNNGSLGKSPNFLDPNWIPVRVQQNLIELHNQVQNKKHQLLQTSQISKSDSNLKANNKQAKKIEKNKKLLSLQNSEEKYTQNLD